MTTPHHPPVPRRAPKARPGQQEQRVLLTVGALAAVLGGWLALARDTAPVPVAGAGGGVAAALPATTQPAAALQQPATSPVRPRAIARTRSSR